MDAYSIVMAPETTNRKSAYAKLQKAMDAIEQHRAELAKHADEMHAEADALFQSWSVSMAGISDPALRAKSEQRLADARARYADIDAQSRTRVPLVVLFVLRACCF